jgi:hypothetical protein
LKKKKKKSGGDRVKPLSEAPSTSRHYLSGLIGMKALNVTGVIVVATIIALAGIALIVASASLLVHSVSATTDVMTTTTVGGEEERATTNDSTTTNNNISNAVLGNLFYSRQGVEPNANPINETYIVISFSDSVMVIPPNAPGVVINATETGNLTVNILPNGLHIGQGQGFITTEDVGVAEEEEEEEEEENATVTFVSLSRTNPDGTGSGTGVAFFSTNSTGQLAFLDNMVGIIQLEISPEGSTGKIREWKGGTLPSENGG